MGVFTINNLSKGKTLIPTSGSLAIPLTNAATYTFSLNDFTTKTNPIYFSPEKDPLGNITITSLPSKGTLFLNGVLVTVPLDVTSSELSNGDLTYQADQSDQEAYDDSDMEFTVSDTNNLTSTPPKPVTFNVLASANRPPDEVGDGSADIQTGGEVIFTRAMLTTALNPPYSDPEGNPAYKLLIDSIPIHGDLYLDTIKVYVGQEILFTDIDLGKFSYVNLSSNLGNDLEGFDFKISDTISQQYTG